MKIISALFRRLQDWRERSTDVDLVCSFIKEGVRRLVILLVFKLVALGTYALDHTFSDIGSDLPSNQFLPMPPARIISDVAETVGVILYIVLLVKAALELVRKISRT